MEVWLFLFCSFCGGCDVRIVILLGPLSPFLSTASLQHPGACLWTLFSIYLIFFIPSTRISYSPVIRCQKNHLVAKLPTGYIVHLQGYFTVQNYLAEVRMNTDCLRVSCQGQKCHIGSVLILDPIPYSTAISSSIQKMCYHQS